ncbi:MAG: hypothetical protein LBG73_04555 [Spirochaetaceae bacterium]|jgi:hypothetical protein|nr:hypothetical protein [Spirochaetaceae bacterium]
MSDLSQEQPQEYEGLESDYEKTEILSGYEIAMSGTPSYIHQIILGELFSQMNEYFREKKGKAVLSPISLISRRR